MGLNSRYKIGRRERSNHSARCSMVPRLLATLLLLLPLPTLLSAQQQYIQTAKIANCSSSSNEDLTLFSTLVEKFSNQSGHITEGDVGDLIVAIAKEFIGVPYISHTLESTTEELVVNLREFDCFTLVESTLALALTLKGANPTFQEYQKQLQLFRYPNGVIEDWSSRLHYTSQWLSYNSGRELLKDLLSSGQGSPIRFNLNFISTHPNSYSALKRNPNLIPKIRESELKGSKLQHFYLPKGSIDSNRELFKNGDIVAFVTSIGGLDISHVGIIYLEPSTPKQNTAHSSSGDSAKLQSRLTFIHASTKKGEVTIEPLSLQEYSLRSKTNRGVMLFRAIF